LDPPPVVGGLTREEPQADATRRWRNEGISEQVAAFRDRVRGEYIEDHPGCKRRDAHEYAWQRALTEFPPGQPPPAPVVSPPPPETPVEAPPGDQESGVAGLGDLPADWPELPANASLQADVQWVAANRLTVLVSPGVVDLSRALAPAPSYSALDWLDTALCFPSKFADVRVKATQHAEDEKEHTRREKATLEETATLLAAMVEPPTT
jgi:hypothetical protein